MRLNKNTDLNNIFKDYSLLVSTNSYILNYNANIHYSYYNKISNTDNIRIQEENELGFKYNIQSENQFNSRSSYSYSLSSYNIVSNSLIVSNLSIDNFTSYYNSYVLYYNTDDGLRQLTYHYKEGNGLYYDIDTHLIGMNIDNYTIREINNKLYFDTNSIPIATENTYGIAYVNNEYLQVNNGILTMNRDYIENIISYKYKISNIYNSLLSLYDSFSYYDRVYSEKTNTTNIYSRYFDNVINYNYDNSNISKNISYTFSSSLYFPNSKLQYIDNYYFVNNLIDPSLKEYAIIDLNESNSYIIYCKDVELIDIYSYNENKYYNHFTSFNDNIMRIIETNIETDIDNSTKEMVDENKIYSYVYNNDLNKYNKFTMNSNIVNNDCIKIGNTNYEYTLSKVRYKNKNIDKKLFKKYGIILNSKLNINSIKKAFIDYFRVGTTVNYNLNLQTVNIKYDSKNIKVLYDDRDISYCTYNTRQIEDHDTTRYYFFTDKLINNVNENLKNIFSFMLQNYDISFDSNISYLFYGYNFVYKDKVLMKNYYALWNDLPLLYVDSKLFTIQNNNGKICSSMMNNFENSFIHNINSFKYNNQNSTNRLYLSYIDLNDNSINSANIYIDF